MAKQNSRTALPQPEPVTNAVATTRTINLDLASPPEASQALTLRDQAQALVKITDVASHRNALEFIRGAKQLRRKVEDHWKKIKGGINELKQRMLDLERQDLDPIDRAIALLETPAIQWKAADDRRIQDEEDTRRRLAEAQARTDRENALAEQERLAADAEARSADLSQRERIFVDFFYTSRGSVIGRALAAIDRAGYKTTDANRHATAQRLLDMPKIQAAIEGKRQAEEIRQQAEAVKATPIDVQPIAPVQRESARVAGVSQVTNYSCSEDIDLEEFRKALLDGTIPIDSVEPHMPTLNRQARDLKELFEAAYPGCKLVKKTGLRG